MSKNPEEVKEQMPKSLIDEFVSYRKYPKYQENMFDQVSKEYWYSEYGSSDDGDDSNKESDVSEINQNKGSDPSDEIEEDLQ
jgi:hypothetical protein